MKTQSLKAFVYRMLCGFLFGISVIAPGVSGSVMAVIMGIYDDLITIVSNPFKNLKKNVVYLTPIGIGAVASVLMFLQVLNWLFDHYPMPGYMLFIGLLAGSLPAVFKEANAGGFKRRYVFAVLGAFAVAVTIGMFARYDVGIRADTTNIVYLSVSGAVAGIASMVPGMSISMILMMLGVYEFLLKSASGFEVLTVMPVVVCFGIGMVLFSRLTKYVFDKYHGFGYFMVFGFMMGSIISIFPGLPKDVLSGVFGAAALAAGLCVSFLFQSLGKKLNRSETAEV